MTWTDFKSHPPPKPKPVDPQGREQLEPPPGKLNFGNIVFGLGILGCILVGLLAFFFFK